jgi:hypothetical protein
MSQRAIFVQATQWSEKSCDTSLTEPYLGALLFRVGLGGYTRMGDYKGAGVETGKKGYYFSTVAGNGTYSQGVLQTIQQSASGVDPRTGRSVTGTTAGVISGKYLGIIQQRLRSVQRGPVEALLPVYDAQGQIIAYERHMTPQALAALERNTHMGEMLGAWKGRWPELGSTGSYLGEDDIIR